MRFEHRRWHGLFFSISHSLLLSGCYTLTQGYEQARLFSRRVPVAQVLNVGSESPERLEKLKLVPNVLQFAERKLGFTPGSSYQHYISLDRKSLSYVVQAAPKRSLKLKTWWFPIVGSQPYLGFFNKSKAIEFQKELQNDGYDTTVGGVQAFSLLGFIPDPLYSSMLDNNDIYQFIELLFHETLHRTIYVPNASVFNENLADFVARKATAAFLTEEHGDRDEAERYLASEHQIQKARTAFREFLKTARQELVDFYARPDVVASTEDEFAAKRSEKFSQLESQYQAVAGEKVRGTNYAGFFKSDRFNNARLLGAVLYEARQEPFEDLLVRLDSDLAKFIQVMGACVEDVDEPETKIWDTVANCKREEGNENG
jgi:predicted aminopeptidase